MRTDDGSAEERPLVVSDDAELLQAVQRVAATVGVEIQVAPPGRTRSRWASPPLVVVGPDQLATLVELSLPRRSGVVVAARSGSLAGDSAADDVGVWQGAVALGAERVVHLPDDEPWLASRLGDLRPGACSGTVVGVVGAVGGCGSSTLAAALAVTAADGGQRVLLVDTDEGGGGLDLLLGAEDAPGSRWPQLAEARGTVAASTLLDVLPEVPDVPGLQVLACTRTGPADPPDGGRARRSTEALDAVLTGAVRGYDLVVLDLGRDAASPESAPRGTDTLLLVVPLRLRAMAAARTFLWRHEELGGRVLVLAREPSPGGLDAADLLAAVDRSVLATVPDDPGRAADEERAELPGRPVRGPLARLCRDLLAELLAHRRAA